MSLIPTIADRCYPVYCPHSRIFTNRSRTAHPPLIQAYKDVKREHAEIVAREKANAAAGAGTDADTGNRRSSGGAAMEKFKSAASKTIKEQAVASGPEGIGPHPVDGKGVRQVCNYREVAVLSNVDCCR